MNRRTRIPAAPVRQQGPPACAAPPAMGALRDARRSRLLTTGTALITLDAKPKR